MAQPQCYTCGRKDYRMNDAKWCPHCQIIVCCGRKYQCPKCNRASLDSPPGRLRN